MNLSAAIMLVNKTVRPVRVEYDPDNKYNNNPMKVFKTIDPDIKKDDLVIVETHTRHGFTIARVLEVDFAVDFHSSEPWGWIAQRFDKDTFDRVKSVETTVQHRVAKAEENKMRGELKVALGLESEDFSDVDFLKLSKAEPTVEEAPSA